ncbi:MAG: shikimate dehydrogenase [Gammaproteobacteria bacterium]|nr:MAG: shikimate dehydrogenase [Gammaproteobacteria bacterium]
MDQYRVFGNPIQHSRSPFIHQSFAKSTKQILDYQTQLVELDDFTRAITEFINQGGKGANVTVPFKEQALEISDELSERARLAGAVNTLTFKQGKIYGDNTDGEGLVQDLLRNKVLLENSRMLILGAGGAVKGVILPLLAQAPKSIAIANRTVSKAELLCQKFNDARLTSCNFSATEKQSFDIIINATSASLSGDIPPIPSSLINSATACYDMVYGKDLTPFLLWTKKQGATNIFDGLGMLVGQAAISFSIWRGVKPEVETVIEQLKKSLAQE